MPLLYYQRGPGLEKRLGPLNFQLRVNTATVNLVLKQFNDYSINGIFDPLKHCSNTYLKPTLTLKPAYPGSRIKYIKTA